MDRDTGSIGGIENPPPPNRSLFYLTIIMDVAGVVLSFLVNWYFTIGLLVYILCSRAYSYRGIRLKQYPVIGFCTVFFVQGAVTFYMIFKGISADAEEVPAGRLRLAAIGDCGSESRDVLETQGIDARAR